MAFNYPYGDTQQLNLNWFLSQWETFRAQWAAAEEGIDHALDAEIARVEEAMTDLYAARDAAAASKTAAQTAATNAASSATVATQQATLAQSYANTAQTQAGIATAAAEAAGNSASSASTSATAANLSKTQAANSATAAQTAQTAAEAAETNIVSIITDAIQDAADAAAATATADAEAAADAAEASATAAAGSASDASDSATAAAGSASDAADSATAAAGSATAAAGSATAAAGSASDAADSATAAAASAASIVVDSAMSDSSTNPVQNKVINGEITELKADFIQLSNGIKTFNYSSTTVQKGAIGSATATENNELSSIISSNNRCMVGPFKLYQSVEIKCSDSAKYKMYKHFSNDSYTAFRDTNPNGWITGNHIEGANPKSGELCNYYLMVAYANDANITDVYDLIKNIEIIYSDKNPLGFVESMSVQTGTGIPSGVGKNTDALRLVSYKQYYNIETLLYCKNGNARFVVYSGDDVYTSSSAGSFKYGCSIAPAEKESVIMVQDYTNSTNTSIKMIDYASFEALYQSFGIDVESIITDGKFVTGNQTLDPYTIANAVTVGGTYLDSIFDTGVQLSDSDAIKYAHVPSLQIADGNAYVVLQCDRSVAEEGAATTEIDLAIVQLSDMTILSYTTIAKSGTYGGVTFNGRCSNPYTALVSGTLHVLFNGMISGTQTLCHAEYDIANSTFTIEPCLFSFGETSYTFNTANYERYIGGYYGIPSMNNEIVVCDPTAYDGKYYIAVSSGNNGRQIKVPIMATTDFETWSIFDVLPVVDGSHCETSMLISGTTAYIADRHPYNDCTSKVMKYNMTTKKIEDYIQLPAVGSRLTLFAQDSSVFVSNPLSGRKTMQIIQLSGTSLGGGNMSCCMSNTHLLAYNAIKQSGNNLYYAIQTKKTKSSSVTYPQIWFGYSDKMVI